MLCAHLIKPFEDGRGVCGFSAAAGPEGKRSLLRAAKAFIATRRYHPLKLMEDNIAIIGVHLGHLDARSAVLAKELDELFRLYGAGKIKPIIGKTFALEEAAAAHRYIQPAERRQGGAASGLAAVVAYKLAALLLRANHFWFIQYLPR